MPLYWPQPEDGDLLLKHVGEFMFMDEFWLYTVYELMLVCMCVRARVCVREREHETTTAFITAVRLYIAEEHRLIFQANTVNVGCRKTDKLV
jgi:hypothetical protein